MSDKLQGFIERRFHKRSDGIVTLSKVHRTFVETLTPSEARLFPRWRCREVLIELGYLLGLNSGGAMAIAGISETPTPTYQLVGGELRLVRP